jgi:hypothetical protein
MVKMSLVEFTSTSVILQFGNSFISPSTFFTVTLVPSVFAYTFEKGFSVEDYIKLAHFGFTP